MIKKKFVLQNCNMGTKTHNLMLVSIPLKNMQQFGAYTICLYMTITGYCFCFDDYFLYGSKSTVASLCPLLCSAKMSAFLCHENQVYYYFSFVRVTQQSQLFSRALAFGDWTKTRDNI
jgi:hypothetical protein